jgi:hypothetical protein
MAAYQLSFGSRAVTQLVGIDAGAGRAHALPNFLQRSLSWLVWVVTARTAVSTRVSVDEIATSARTSRRSASYNDTGD